MRLATRFFAGEGIRGRSLVLPVALTAFLAPGLLAGQEAPPGGSFRNVTPGRTSAIVPLAQPLCSVCLTGSAAVTWGGAYGSFHVDHVVNGRSTATAPLQLQVILSATPPVWGQTISYYSFSGVVSLAALGAGMEYDNVNSGSVYIYGGTIPAGTYFQLLWVTESGAGTGSYDDFLVFPTKVSCDGMSCATTTLTASCVEDATTMCLVGGRYRITSHWQDQYAGGAVSTLNKATLTGSTGAFWLSDPNSYEYLIRISTDTPNGRAWISIPTFTDVEFWVLVEDLFNGQSQTYHSPPGNRTLIYDPYFFVYP